MKLTKTNQKGIYFTKNKSEKITYYGSYKSKITNNSVRKKLLVKDKHLEKYAKECLILLDKIKEENQNYNTDIVNEENEYQNYLTLNQLADIYFKNRYEYNVRRLKEQFPHIEDVENNNITKAKLRNLKSVKSTYTINVGNYPISQLNVNTITRKICDDYIENYLSSRPLSQKTKFDIISIIKTIFNFAIRKDIINIKNPFQNIKFKNPNKQRQRVLNQDEIKLLLQKSKEYKQNRNVYLAIYLAVLTGARANTILNIRKKDIELNSGFIYLYNFKASRKYKLRLTNQAVVWLENKILPYYEDDEYLLRHTIEARRKIPHQPLYEIPRTIYKIMDKLFNKGLDKTNNQDRDMVVNFHTIRRSIATNLALSGTSLYDVMVFLNHSNIEQTMKYLNLDSNNLHTNVSSLMDNIFSDFK